jgi:hypothetical protein
MQLTFRDCLEGEIYKQISDDIFACTICPEG